MLIARLATTIMLLWIALSLHTIAHPTPEPADFGDWTDTGCMMRFGGNGDPIPAADADTFFDGEPFPR